MKNWLYGIIWPGIQVSANAPGTTKYWQDGAPFGDVFPTTPAAPVAFVPKVMWFT